MKKRIVVTGMGSVNPLGLSVDTSWQAALSGQSGISRLDQFDEVELRTRIAGQLQGFDAADYLPAKDARRYDPFVHYAMAAAKEAIAQAGLEGYVGDADRIGVLVGSGIGGISTLEANAITLDQRGPRRVSPMFIPGSIINIAAGLISIEYGFKGPNLAVGTACTTSTHAIGLAARLIAYGDADVIIAGGSEKGSSLLGMAGFSSMQALSTRNDEPTLASRPFDKDRDGFVMGDGAGVLVIESLEHALERGASILAEVCGFGMSSDASHITAPPSDGEGAQRAMRAALKDADLAPEAIGYINAHGTSTPLGDVAESKAIESVFGAHAKQLKISSTKSMTGHLLGAAGAVEAIFCLKALLDSKVPPTINLQNVDPECTLDYVANHACDLSFNYALSNSFGFGGTNGTLIFSRFDG
jgi:3-oxoacyl-[acyl-carrier-protein] synthase II